ncbi:TIGR03943 family protein [Microbacterium sp. H1-D42]|uniref:TIGR03943 family putative permease subunit n=1 Tax=Microbacterium sp. H1-D42 TaxID=2925844 RepID=UPI001F532BEC|nr:TIGR03943 family protein [Microbacterium sp. H1-D42]UNK71008.1 TIGR03943 family protein [Microbacterium sp. H1-D42]
MAEHEGAAPKLHALATRWLGVGLATVLAVVTLGLAVTGRLTLYISPETVWFAAAAAAVTLILAVWSCTLPLGAEGDHDHTVAASGSDAAAARRRVLQTVAVVSGGVISSAVVLAALLLPPASLSAELAVSRAGETPTLFAGSDDVSLGVADTTTFGVGEWSTAFATSTRPEKYDGAPVTLTGFVTPAEDGDVNLTRMVISHCVIDAQPASVAIAGSGLDESYDTGQWIEVAGTVRADSDGTLRVEPASVTKIEEPKDPYEY